MKAGILRQRGLHHVALELGVRVRKAKCDLYYRALVLEVEVDAVVIAPANLAFRVPRTEPCLRSAPEIGHEGVGRMIAPARALPSDEESSVTRGEPLGKSQQLFSLRHRMLGCLTRM